MHETPPRFRTDLYLHQTPPSPGMAFSASCGEDEEVECPLFLLCERVAEAFLRDRERTGEPEVSRRRMERRIRRRFRLSAPRAAALFELAMELRHLRTHDRYRRSVAEVGRLIALVSGAELRPEDN